VDNKGVLAERVVQTMNCPNVMNSKPSLMVLWEEQ